jgi:WhiB family redox-sensing transcriptional regulator
MAEISRLPGPAAHQWVWQQHGSCRRLSPDAFFHPEGERGSARVSRATAAKRVCDDCPVSLTQCRIHALSAREPYGIWGGLTEEERAAALAGRADIPA